MNIAIKLLRESAKMPAYQTDGAAGLDLHWCPCQCDGTIITVTKGARYLFGTGIAVSIPPGFEGQVRPRSGLAHKEGVVAVVGTIDSDYRGEVMVTLINHGDSHFTVRAGDRIAQLVIAPVVRATLVQVDELDQTARGTKGHGSTGR